MKKLFPEEKTRRKKVMEFLDKRGFYVVLLLCIAIVGGTLIYVTTRSTSLNEFDYNPDEIMADQVEGNGLEDSLADGTATSSISEADNTDPSMAAGVTAAEGPAKAADSASGTGGVTGMIASDPASATGTDSVTGSTSGIVADAGKTATNTGTAETDSALTADDGKKTAATDKATSSMAVASETSKSASGTAMVKEELIMPVFGEITFEYAKDKLLYSRTLEEWRTHEGLDIGADRGDAVKAAAAGVVSAIKNDPRYGVVIVIDHENGLKTVYANLASDEAVAVNQKVEQGEVIGSIGDTASFESIEQSHLHFEVLIDDIAVDPLAYLPLSQEESS